MPRYVILRHEMPEGYVRASHWDLMLQMGSSLRTWALQQEPSVGAAIDAELLASHRLAYLDYQGEVSGGRGSVARWDAGHYEVLEQTGSRLVIVLHGDRLKGQAILEQQADNEKRWRVTLTQ